MFKMRYKENNSPLHTLIWRSVIIVLLNLSNKLRKRDKMLLAGKELKHFLVDDIAPPHDSKLSKPDTHKQGTQITSLSLQENVYCKPLNICDIQIW